MYLHFTVPVFFLSHPEPTCPSFFFSVYVCSPELYTNLEFLPLTIPTFSSTCLYKCLWDIYTKFIMHEHSSEYILYAIWVAVAQLVERVDPLL